MMKYGVKISFWLGGILLSLCLTTGPAEANFSVCFDCHDEEQFQGKIVHEPVADGDCGQCHSPHVSKHEGLLLADQRSLCFTCHDDIKDRLDQDEYIHPPLQQGNCSACHAPHSSANPALLRYDLEGACYDCHDQPVTAKYGHAPYLSGECSACHDPHSSADFRFLRETGAALCLKCHDQSKDLTEKHLGRDLQQIDCLSCHNPHGSESQSLVRSVTHMPFAEKSCDACHAEESGINVCLQCHEDVLPSFNRTHSHLRATDADNLCVSCHNPHAGDREGFFPSNQGMVCRSCHEETFERRKQTLYKHTDWDNCSNCHTLHGSDQVAMFITKPSEVCSGCHEDHSTFTHPLGENALDPRTGQPMTCVSCHDANVGTEFKYFLRGGAEKGLCVQCHRGY